MEISQDGQTWYTLWQKEEDGKDVWYWADAEGYDPSYALPQDYNDLFKWLAVEPTNPQDIRYLRITGRADKGLLELGELALFDEDGLIDLTGLTTGGEALFDEQDTVPELSTWYNSTYFDEIYHPRTALEHIEGVYPYEVSHPPLGKLTMSLGILLFGMTPFGWRFMGTLFGVLMLPLLYVFLKNLFGKRPVAACGTILFAADFMHLTQTRIGTIDTYGVFYILLMYYFLYRWLTLAPGTPFRRCALPLFLSGLFWGIGAASKWTVIYGAVGLAVLYFIGLGSKLRDWPAEAPGKLPWLWKTLAFSVLCFVLLPVLIYTLSYWPYAAARGNDAALWGILAEIFAWPFTQLPLVLSGERELFVKDSQNVVDIMLQNQHFMLTYHEGVTASHPYSSRWYQWIVDARPILYYLDNTSARLRGSRRPSAASTTRWSAGPVCWPSWPAWPSPSAERAPGRPSSWRWPPWRCWPACGPRPPSSPGRRPPCWRGASCCWPWARPSGWGRAPWPPGPSPAAPPPPSSSRWAGSPSSSPGCSSAAPPSSTTTSPPPSSWCWPSASSLTA